MGELRKAIDRNAVIEECAKDFEGGKKTILLNGEEIAYFLRALKSQPTCGGEGCTEVCQACAQSDPRAEVIRLLKEKFEHIREYWNGDTNHAAMVDALNHIDDVAFEAIAAIDKVIGEK